MFRRYSKRALRLLCRQPFPHASSSSAASPSSVLILTPPQTFPHAKSIPHASPSFFAPDDSPSPSALPLSDDDSALMSTPYKQSIGIVSEYGCFGFCAFVAPRQTWQIWSSTRSQLVPPYQRSRVVLTHHFAPVALLRPFLRPPVLAVGVDRLIARALQAQSRRRGHRHVEPLQTRPLVRGEERIDVFDRRVRFVQLEQIAQREERVRDFKREVEAVRRR